MELISEYRNESRSAEVYRNNATGKYLVKCYDGIAPDDLVLKHLTDGKKHGYRTLSEAELACDDWVNPEGEDNWTYSLTELEEPDGDA